MLLVSRYGTISSVSAATVKVVTSTTAGAHISTNGTDWTYVAFTTSLTGTHAETIGDSGIVIGGRSTDEIRYSADGTSYSESSAFSFSPQGNSAMWQDSDIYALIAWQSAAPVYNLRLAFSSNGGATWTADNPGIYSTGTAANDVLRADGNWIVVGDSNSGSSLNYKATLGTGSWTQPSTPFSVARGIAFDGTNYVITNGTSTVYTTTNLSTFTSRSAGANITKVAYGNGRFVAVGASTRYSTDGGVTWSAGGSFSPAATARTIRFSESLGKFFVEANNQYVYTSTDGTSWSSSIVGATTLQGIGVR